MRYRFLRRSGTLAAATVTALAVTTVAPSWAATSTTSSAAATSDATADADQSAADQSGSDCVDIHALSVQGTGQSSPGVSSKANTGFLGSLYNHLNAELTREGSGSGSGSSAAGHTSSTPHSTHQSTTHAPHSSASASSSAASSATTTGKSDKSEAKDDRPASERFDNDFIDYDASMAGVGMKADGTPEQSASYTDSVNGALSKLTDKATEILDACPDTKLFPVGYSQGADVVDQFLAAVGSGASPVPADSVAGGVVFGAPRRGEGMSVIPGGGDRPNGPDGRQLDLPAITAPTAGGAGLLPAGDHVDDYGALTGQVANFCTDGDLVCSTPEDSPAVRTAAKMVANTDLTAGDPFTAMSQLGDAMSLAPLRAASSAVNEDVSGTTLDTVEFNPSKSISQRLEDASTQPVSTPSSGGQGGQGGKDDEVTGVMPGLGQSSGSSSSSSSASSTPSAPSTPSAASSGSGSTDSSSADGASPVQQGQDAMAALTKLGMLGMNTVTTIARDTFTPDTIAQVAAVGLADPQAGLAVLGSKAAASATKVLAPVGMKAAEAAFDLAEKEVDDNKGLVKMATDVTYWRHWENHASYQSAPVTEDGTSATDYTADWIKALLIDDGSGDASSSASVTSGTSTSTRISSSSSAGSAASGQQSSEPAEPADPEESARPASPVGIAGSNGPAGSGEAVGSTDGREE